MGTAKAPDGETITVTGTCLRRNGKPWLPVMGEFHFSRYPKSEWRSELLKMKAGGIDIVATYVFWIHHEEVEGDFDWTSQRDLRAFVQLCKEAGLPIVVRCGPWCHGEVRNGGLPDWLLTRALKPRTNDPAYLEYVRRLYGQIALQLKGLLWKDGGSVVGIQLENEYAGPAEHLLTLKQIARDAGIDVPLYTRTGWPDPSTPIPFGQLLPLHGAYAEGFWDRSLDVMPGMYWRSFCFESVRADAEVGADQLGQRDARDAADAQQYPYLTCEIGGGMEQSYHRRIFIDSMDIVAVVTTKLGSGSNLPGYYMYHGGTNPQGKRSTLHESQATRYWNDVPVLSYDFQAPLGQFGQVRDHYHLLRRLHLFLRDFGPELTTMSSHLGTPAPQDREDDQTVRWAVRSDGRSGFLFVNNFQRRMRMPAKAGVQFEIKLTDQTLHVPAAPTTIAADSSFFWPFNLDLAGARLIHATAQPLSRVEDGETSYFFFTESGAPAEFVFAAGCELVSSEAQLSREPDRISVQRLPPGLTAQVVLRTSAGRKIAIILLDQEMSKRFWKLKLGGRERAIVCDANLLVDGSVIRVSKDKSGPTSLALLPPPSLFLAGRQLKAVPDGAFSRFDLPRPHFGPAVAAQYEMVRSAGALRMIGMGHGKVAEAPTDADFDDAAAWRIKLPGDVDPNRDLLLRIHYIGDVARLYLDGKLINDNFYNGRPFDLSLRRTGPRAFTGELMLKILPLQKGAPIQLPPDAMPDFGGSNSHVSLNQVEVIEHCCIDIDCPE